MKILITGKPASGKTTLLENFIGLVASKQGFIAKEVRKNGQRVSFELISAGRKTATLARVDSPSTLRVGRFGVELEQFEEFIKNLPAARSGDVLYIDEIGQMELLSESFITLLNSYLNSDNLFIGTISQIFTNDVTEAILARKDIVLLEITPDNREAVAGALQGLAANHELLHRLNSKQKQALATMAGEYARAARLVQIKKLFANTIKYLAEGRVTKAEDASYLVRGNTREHRVRTENEQWHCDCDLFNGKGQFRGMAGECSHIQSAKLFVIMFQ